MESELSGIKWSVTSFTFGEEGVAKGRDGEEKEESREGGGAGCREQEDVGKGGKNRRGQQKGGEIENGEKG